MLVLGSTRFQSFHTNEKHDTNDEAELLAYV